MRSTSSSSSVGGASETQRSETMTSKPVSLLDSASSVTPSCSADQLELAARVIELEDPEIRDELHDAGPSPASRALGIA